MKIDRKRLLRLLRQFRKTKVLVIGDVILDQFIWGDVSRISPEAPVPVVLVERESCMPGGAANVASCISALEGQALLIGVVGKDSWASKLKEKLKRKGITKGLVVDSSRRTSLKTRIVARHQQVVRVDNEIVAQINKKITEKVIAEIKRNAHAVKAIVIEDYGKGMISPYLIKEIIAIARKKKIIVTVDPKEEHFYYYRGVHCITPNQHEAEKATGIKIVDKKTLTSAGKNLLKKLNARAVLLTRGEHGMCLFQKGKKAEEIPTRAQEVFDVSGAGDTVIGTFTLALAGGASYEEAAHISNYAAGIVVGKVGVGSCSQKELTSQIERDRSK